MGPLGGKAGSDEMFSTGAVGQHEEAVRRDRGHAVEGEPRAREAIVGELPAVVAAGGGRETAETGGHEQK